MTKAVLQRAREEELTEYLSYTPKRLLTEVELVRPAVPRDRASGSDPRTTAAGDQLRSRSKDRLTITSVTAWYGLPGAGTVLLRMSGQRWRGARSSSGRPRT